MSNQILTACVHEIKSVLPCTYMYTHLHIYVCLFCKPSGYKMYAEDSCSGEFTPQRGLSDVAIDCNFLRIF